MSDPFSPYDRLALSTDGRLDPAAVLATLVADEQPAPDGERGSPIRGRSPGVAPDTDPGPTPDRPIKPRIRVPASTPARTVAAMADSLIAGAERLGAVGARWLREHGFADPTIDAYGDAAVAEAARRRPDLAA